MSLLAQQTPANTQSECVLSVLLATGPAAVGVRADFTQIISSVVGSVRPVFLTRIWTPLNFLRSDWLIFVFSLMMASITYISLDLLLYVCVCCSDGLLVSMLSVVMGSQIQAEKFNTVSHRLLVQLILKL